MASADQWKRMAGEIAAFRRRLEAQMHATQSSTDDLPVFRRLGAGEAFEALVETITSINLASLAHDPRIALWLADQLDQSLLEQLLVPVREAADMLGVNGETLRRAAANPEIPFAEALSAGQARYWRIHVHRLRIMREIHPPMAGGGRLWVPPPVARAEEELLDELYSGEGSKRERIARMMARLRAGREDQLDALSRDDRTGDDGDAGD